MAIDFKDYYATLGVKKGASADDIKQAFRKLARVHHPDVAKNKAAGEEKFKEINEAYEVLSDSEKRGKYDRLGPDWQAEQAPAGTGRGQQYQSRPGPHAESFSGFSDFFDSLFGQASARGFRGDDAVAPGPRQGQDVEAELPLTLEDALQGGDKKLSLLAPVLCPACRGTGRRGAGFCPACGGVGEAKQETTITVHLPKLIRDGAKLRLRGQGGPASGGAPAGDLFLRIKFLPHPQFQVSGSDLETTVTVMPWEASLGAEVAVPALEGPLHIRVPAGTHAGRRLRVTGRGLAKEGGARGNLYAKIRIDIPERTNEKLERLFKEMREAGA